MWLTVIKWFMSVLYLWVMASVIPQILLAKNAKGRLVACLTVAMQVASLMFVWIW